jgi:hypothetical protein
MLRDGDPAGMLSLDLLRGLSLWDILYGQLGQGLKRGSPRLTKGIEDEGIEPELVGIEPLGSSAVDSAQELFDLVLEHPERKLSGAKLLGEGLDLEVFLLEEVEFMRRIKFHGAI